MDHNRGASGGQDMAVEYCKSDERPQLILRFQGTPIHQTARSNSESVSQTPAGISFSTTPMRRSSGSFCRALRTRSNGVEFERTTIRIPSQTFAIRPESEVGNAAGASMMIQSNRGSRQSSKTFKRLETSSGRPEAGRPDAMKKKFAIVPLWIIPNSSVSPRTYSEKPGVAEVPREECKLGLRKSASTSNTRQPGSSANTCARFAATKDLPSLGTALVTKILRSECLSRTCWSRERSVRNSSVARTSSPEPKKSIVFAFGVQVLGEQRSSRVSRAMESGPGDAAGSATGIFLPSTGIADGISTSSIPTTL